MVDVRIEFCYGDGYDGGDSHKLSRYPFCYGIITNVFYFVWLIRVNSLHVCSQDDNFHHRHYMQPR